jgi:hypothetical protein
MPCAALTLRTPVCCSIRSLENDRKATVLYNLACVFCGLNRQDEAMIALRKAWDGGFKDPQSVRRDPDLATLHGNPE